MIRVSVPSTTPTKTPTTPTTTTTTKTEHRTDPWTVCSSRQPWSRIRHSWTSLAVQAHRCPQRCPRSTAHRCPPTEAAAHGKRQTPSLPRFLAQLEDWTAFLPPRRREPLHIVAPSWTELGSYHQDFWPRRPTRPSAAQGCLASEWTAAVGPS